MDINIYDDINTVTQRYYGTEVTPATAQELWAKFCSKISTPTKEYLTVTSSVDKEEVRKALANFVQGAIAAMVAEGESPPDFSSPEVQSLINTLKQKLVDLRGQPELDGLISTDKNIVYATLIALCGDLTLTQALTSLLTRAAATIAERGAALPTLYLDFLSQMIEAAKTSEATVALSPREEEVRRIMFEVFNLALEMIRVLQRSSILQSNLLYYYTSMQREYSTMMSKTSLYGPTVDQAIIADASDFGKTSVGHGVTIRNVVDYLMEDLINNPTKTSTNFWNSSVSWWEWEDLGSYEKAFMPLKFVLSRSTDGGFTLSLQGSVSSTYTTFMSTAWISSDGTNYSAQNPEVTNNRYYPSDTLTGTQQTTDVVNRLLYHITQQWNQTPGGYSSPGGFILKWGTDHPEYEIDNLAELKSVWSAGAELKWYNAGLSGPITEAYKKKPSGTAEEQAKARQEASTFRSEVNSLLQVYMENARALKDMAKEAAKRSESVLTQLKEAVQNQSNFLSAITECLRGMLSAIFR